MLVFNTDMAGQVYFHSRMLSSRTRTSDAKHIAEREYTKIGTWVVL
jgi:hypothetical protein